MKMARPFISVLLALAVPGACAIAAPRPEAPSLEQVMADLSAARTSHPMLFATREEFEAVKSRIESDATLKAAFARLRAEADFDCALPAPERKLEGKRLLNVARDCLKRILDCAMMYRLTGEEKYREGAIRVADAAIGFRDWNPDHFLDVAEFSLAVSLAYDWLYGELGEERRKKYEEGLVRLALEPLWARNHWWISCDSNWCSVCHAGMMAAAFTLKDANPGLSAKTIHSAVANLWRPVAAIYPDGAYPEGPIYWQYGTGFHLLAIDMLENVLGTSYGLGEMKGWESTADWLNIVTGPSGKFFNYADGSATRNADQAPWWFARRYNRPGIVAEHELPLLRELTNGTEPGKGGAPADRLFALTFLWYRPVPEGATAKLPREWHSGAIAVQREGDFFVGLKGGTPSVNHGHMDVGSFVIDAGGIRWGWDLDAQNYHSIEKRGMYLWDMKQGSDRWKVFRINNFSHNTLVIDGQLQQVSGYASIESPGDESSNIIAIDMTSLYPMATSVRRTGELAGNGYVLKDAVKGLKPGAKVRWSMMTCAKIESVNGPVLVLKDGGKRLALEQLGGIWTWEAEESPCPNEWDASNDGFRQLAFTATAPESGEIVFGVKFGLVPAGIRQDAAKP